jgi:hypothetical protein
MFCDLVGSTAPSVRLDRGSARDHPPPITAASPTMSTASTGSSPSTWATGCWSISATRGLTRMMPSGSSGCAGLNRQCRSARRLDVKSVKLQARFGIATGLVVVGDLIGEGSAQEQSVVGDTPNLAARLQPFGRAGCGRQFRGINAYVALTAARARTTSTRCCSYRLPSIPVPRSYTSRPSDN